MRREVFWCFFIFVSGMKSKLSLLAVLVFLFSFNSLSLADEETNATLGRIGIYDSRAVAFAYFSSAPYQSNLKQQVAAARAAQQSGDTNKFVELKTALRNKQDEMHREVFSTAAVDEALATLKDKIPAIEKQAGVGALVSKWDETALKQNARADQVDVTDQLVREFLIPTEKQLKTIESFKASKPLPLDQVNELIRKGQI
jgi:hypothetical protein